MDEFVGQKMRALVLLRLPGGDVEAGETFTFTEDMARGLRPDMWIECGQAELVTSKTKATPRPKADEKAADADETPPGVSDGDTWTL